MAVDTTLIIIIIITVKCSQSNTKLEVRVELMYTIDPHNMMLRNHRHLCNVFQKPIHKNYLQLSVKCVRSLSGS